MKIVVIGGTGLIGSKLVTKLRAGGHEVLAASPASGVNTLTGEGLERAFDGAEVVVDVANSPSFEDKAVMTFFETAARNIFPAESKAKVRHHVALSVVGADRMPDSGYMRAKVAQEEAIKASGVPYTILRATQFFEFLGAIADAGTNGDTVRLPFIQMQPIAAEDVAAALAGTALTPPRNATVDLAGPSRLRIDDAVRRYLSAKRDARFVIPDTNALYYGAKVDANALVPESSHLSGLTLLDNWLAVPQGR